MPEALTHELVVYLQHARDLERVDLRLLREGVAAARDATVRNIYRSHRHQTEQHLRRIEDRLRGHGFARGLLNDHASVGALEIGFTQEATHTPTQLAISAYAFENLEIAAYHVLDHLARRCDDEQTMSIVAEILDEEEQAAELLASTFDRALAASLPRSNAH